jgi:hypothetical protein
MDRSDLGLSNPYLKIGTVLVTASLAAVAFTSFFPVDRELQATVRNIGGLALFSGAVVYVIGRLVQAKRARAQA